MTDKEKQIIENAIQHLQNIKNNIGDIETVNLVDIDFYFRNTWNESMIALQLLEKLTKTTPRFK